MRNPRFCLPGSAAICKKSGTRDDERRLNVKSMEAGSLLATLLLAAATKPVTAQSAVASRGLVTYECMQAGRGSDRLPATFYRTTMAMVLIEHRGGTRAAFEYWPPAGEIPRPGPLVLGRAWRRAGNVVGRRAQVPGTLDRPERGTRSKKR